MYFNILKLSDTKIKKNDFKFKNQKISKIEVDDDLFEWVPIKRAKATKQSIKDYFAHFHLTIENKEASHSFHPKVEKKQVVIKNIGNMKIKHLYNALNYAIQNIEDRGESVLNQDFEMQNLQFVLKEWEKDFNKQKPQNEGMHLIFSIQEANNHENMEVLKLSVFNTLKSNLLDYNFILVPHSHQNNPHIHCFINKTHIYTGRKLHFANRNEFRDFFHQLREDFKNNLYLFSGTRLDYSNEPRNYLTNIAKKNFDNFNHKSFLLPIYNNLSKKIRLLENKIKHLNQDILEFNKKHPQELRKINEMQKMEDLRQKVIKNQWALSKTKSEFEKFLEFENQFEKLASSRREVEKKGFVINFLKKVDRRFLDKKSIKNLKLLEDERELLKNALNIEGKKLIKSFDERIYQNHKNAYQIKKELFILDKMAKIESNEEIKQRKDTLMLEMQERKKEIIQMIQNYAKLAQIEELQKKKQKKLLQLQKELEYLEKSDSLIATDKTISHKQKENLKLSKIKIT
ncbi:relaxase/mobilization nuclease domain-containing protein [Helicobacter anatolicus]|uniref:relaxase/mobilization nuclease domain-containing protein n=1 Tax=Helicobacter anatolicus TaxID=2905874 RepID=UPI001E5F0B14|nr:hypothetical protein [Helicobacter anatolicus]